MEMAVGFFLGLVATVIGQFVNHLLDSKKNKVRFSNEQALETRRLRHAYRKERVKTILEQIDSLTASIQLTNLMGDPKLMSHIPESSREVLERLANRTSRGALEAMNQMPRITDSVIQRKINLYLVTFTMPPEIRKGVLGSLGFSSEDAAATDVYSAIEAYVVSED